MKTVKVRMLESVSGEGDEHNGIEGSFSLAAREEVEIPAELADKWVACGRCVILADGESDGELQTAIDEARVASEKLEAAIEKEAPAPPAKGKRG